MSKTVNLFLSPGDLVQIVAPASGTKTSDVKQSIKFLKSLGLKVLVSPKLIQPPLRYLSNTDKFRFEDLKKALLNHKVKAIWCLRGGYGSQRLLPFLNQLPVPKKKKLLIGFSDIAALHHMINLKWGWKSLHATGTSYLSSGKLEPSSVKETSEVVFGLKKEIIFKNLSPINQTAKKSRLIEAPIVGGNLRVLTSLVGTPFQFSNKGKILFLEDVNETAYRVDRYLTQMAQGGFFDGVKAVVFGDFTDCKEPDGKFLIPATLRAFFKSYKFPVLTGLKAGHDPKVERPLFFNTYSELQTGRNPFLKNYLT